MSKSHKHDKHDKPEKDHNDEKDRMHDMKMSKHERKNDDNHDKGDHACKDDFFQELRAADQIYFAEFEALNNSGVEGYALLTVDYGRSNTTEDDTLTVRIAASGLDEGVHLQHMHGFETGQDAVTPTSNDDTDGDGRVELLEGLPRYGQILLNLDDKDGEFPVTEQEGSFYFEQTYHLPSRTDDEHNSESHAGDIVTTFKDLDLNHLVIHGMEVPENAGRGTPGEVGDQEKPGSMAFDQDTYKEVLPVAVAEIEAVNFWEARHFVNHANDDGLSFA